MSGETRKPIAYLRHPLSSERKAEYLLNGFMILDLKFAPVDLQDPDVADVIEVEQDTDPVDTVDPVDPIDPANQSEPALVIDPSKDGEDGDKNDAGETGETGQSGKPEDDIVNPNIGVDSGEAFTDDQLREIITTATGKAPHYKAGREKLLEAYTAANLAAAQKT